MSGKKHRTARLGVFGDLPVRFLCYGLNVTPWFLEPVLVLGWTMFFFLIARSQRNAVTHNLRAMHPDWGRLRGVLGAWRVFWNFSVTYADAMRCETGTGSVDWVVDGLKPLEELSSRTDGCIILTAHMGNYDIAAPMFASRFNRTLYTVRAPEREPETQSIREEEIRRKEAAYPNFKSLYNHDGNMLGIELARLLADGNIVALQGDRVMFDVSPMEVEVEAGLRMSLPRGPLFLARATRAPCYPLFITRDGWRRYRVTVRARLELPARRRDDDEEISKIWAAAVFQTARNHWYQWFVFEPVFERDPRHPDT